MKVKIGPYLNWWGPYQIAELLKYVGVPEDKYRQIGKRLRATKLNDICEWVYSKRKRSVHIRIDNYDVWNVDTSLSMIIFQILIKFKRDQTGHPFVRDEYVPEALQSHNAQPKENEFEWDSLNATRFEYVLEEILYAFRYMTMDDMFFDTITIDMQLDCEKRVTNGLKLFGIFYQALWT